MREIHSIIRAEEVKTWTQLSAKNNHNHRLKDVQNASPDKDIKVLIGSSDITADVKSHMINQGIDPDKIRKNGVICNEIIATLSPEFFTDNKLDYKDRFNKNNTNNFVKIAKRFLEETYGDNLVNLVLHLDETTPHLHAIVVPIYQDISSGCFKLAARRFFDRPHLQLLQKRYCAAFSHLKDYQTTYKEKSQAKHNDIRTFYTRVNETKSDYEDQLVKKDSIISKLRQERSKLRREVTHYQVMLSKVQKHVKKVEAALSSFPEQFTYHIHQVITKIISFTVAKYNDVTVEDLLDNLDINKECDMNDRMAEKPNPKLQPPTPFRRPKPKP